MAYLAIGNGTNRITIRGTTPAAVGSVTAERADSTVTITWDAVSGVSSYLVEVSTNGGSTWSTLTTTGSTSTADSISSGQTKHYRVTPQSVWGSPGGTASSPVTFTASSGNKIAVVPATHMTLVGGYRIPTWSGIVNNNTGTPRGGMTCWTDVDGAIGPAGRFYVWTENGERGRRVLENYASSAMGTSSSPSSWPLMIASGSNWSAASITGTTSGFDLPTGLVFDEDNLRLLVSLKSIYWTSNPGDPAYWLGGIEYPARTVNESYRTNLSSYRMQRYGGGLSILPQAWANAHTGGKRLAFTAGALSSGQGGNAGPTFGVLGLDEVGGSPTVLRGMDWLSTDEVGADVYSDGGDKEPRPGPYARGNEVERAFNDYGGYPGGLNVDGTPHPESSYDAIEIPWCYWPDTPRSQGLTQDGYFGTSTIRGGGTWVENNDFSCLMYSALSPKGRVYYPYQTENLSDSRTGNIYVYNPDDVAAVMAGTMERRSIRANFYRWGSSSTSGIASRGANGARALCYDRHSNLLWVYFTRVWQSGTQYFPVVAAYSLTA